MLEPSSDDIIACNLLLSVGIISATHLRRAGYFGGGKEIAEDLLLIVEGVAHSGEASCCAFGSLALACAGREVVRSRAAAAAAMVDIRRRMAQQRVRVAWIT